MNAKLKEIVIKVIGYRIQATGYRKR